MDTRGFNDKDITSSLDGIAEAISSGGGGGSSLPAVTSDDNGKVLTVVNGARDKATASGGGDVFDITYDVDNTTITNISKTTLEIINAIKAGKRIVCNINYSFSGGSVTYNNIPLNGYNMEEGEVPEGEYEGIKYIDFSYNFVYSYLTYSGGNMQVYEIIGECSILLLDPPVIDYDDVNFYTSNLKSEK